jgi:hypothetical protein
MSNPDGTYSDHQYELAWWCPKCNRYGRTDRDLRAQDCVPVVERGPEEKHWWYHGWPGVVGGRDTHEGHATFANEGGLWFCADCQRFFREPVVEGREE